MRLEFSMTAGCNFPHKIRKTVKSFGQKNWKTTITVDRNWKPKTKLKLNLQTAQDTKTEKPLFLSANPEYLTEPKIGQIGNSESPNAPHEEIFVLS